MQQVLFIGLGTMGYPMAGHLSKSSDIALSVFNRTTAKALKWQQEFTGAVVENLTDSISVFDIIILCSGQDEDMEEIFFNTHKGIVPHIKAGAIVVDHTTISYQMTLKIAHTLQKNAVHFIDAPVSGGEIGAQNGVLAIMTGGDENILTEITPLLNHYAKSITHMGEVGNGQLAKMANQICITGVLQGLSEAVLFAEANNLDVNTLLAAISGGAAGSWQMNNRMQTMHQREFDFGFAITWMIKDLTYTLNQAKEKNLELELTEEVLKHYQSLLPKYAKCDTSSLIVALDKKN